MRYVDCTFKAEQEEFAYRIYVTDSLKLAGENKALVDRFADLVRPKNTDKRTADEIALDTIRTLGLRFEEE